MTIGGAGRLFKPIPTTPRKTYTDDESSAGSPLPSDESYTAKSHKCKSQSGKKNTASPFEIAARKAEKQHSYVDSDSTSDFDLPVVGNSKSGLSGIRKVGSAESRKEKGSGRYNGESGKTGVENGDPFDEPYLDEDNTPTKKRKTSGRGSAVAIELD